MGKGEQRSRRGNIHRGTFGKRRPKKARHATKPETDESAQKGTKKEPEASV